ncbi:bifunctional DNA primase/polymerase [Streptomyces sp. NPDC059680]|uniref:bifunctional DNA primase/polymerase n=1 Tax=Streptomyces sp. NPDC059680 TaxID=3346904 RepID=UPI0036B06030
MLPNAKARPEAGGGLSGDVVLTQSQDTRSVFSETGHLPGPEDSVAWALWLAWKGMYVFPVDHPDNPKCIGARTKEHDPAKCTDRGKHPAVKWSAASTTDERTVYEWSAEWPHVNFAIDCGKSNLVVIDADTPTALEDFVGSETGRRLGAEIPDSLTVETGKGRHVYLRQPAGDPLTNREGEFRGRDINIRGAGGYVVAPGSKHASGRHYAVTGDTVIRPVPGWVEAATRGRRPDKERAALSGPEDTFEFEGRRFLWSNVLQDAAALRSGSQRGFLMAALGSMWARGWQPEAARIVAQQIAAAFKVYRPESPWEPGAVDAIVEETCDKWFEAHGAGEFTPTDPGEDNAGEAPSWMTDEHRDWLSDPQHAKAAAAELERRMTRKVVDAYEARTRVSAVMTVSQALDIVLSGQALVSPTVARLEGDRRGWGLFYPGLVNGTFGDASVGKSVIVAEVQARTLDEGGIVVHWEFDNNPLTVIVARLLHAGASPDDIRAGRFQVLYSTADRDALTDDVRRAVKLVTLDALNPAITSLALDPYHPGGVDSAVREFFAPFTLHGACGLFVDHVGHESKDRQAGSIRKAQAVQGALYECQMESPLKPGLTGRTRLILRKDNQGALGDLVGKTVATAVMTSRAEKGAPAGRVLTTFEQPDPFVSEEKEEPKWTDEERIEWAIRKMDEAGVPTGRGINATHEWMDGEGVKISLRKSLKDRAIKARNHRAEKQAAVPDTGGGPTDPPPLRVSGAIPSDTR